MSCCQARLEHHRPLSPKFSSLSTSIVFSGQTACTGAHCWKGGWLLKLSSSTYTAHWTCQAVWCQSGTRGYFQDEVKFSKFLPVLPWHCLSVIPRVLSLETQKQSVVSFVHVRIYQNKLVTEYTPLKWKTYQLDYRYGTWIRENSRLSKCDGLLLAFTKTHKTWDTTAVV